MIIVKIWGGLGNQMFQYAFGISKSLRLLDRLKFDVTAYKDYKLRKFELEDAFSLKLDLADQDEIQDFKAVTRYPLRKIFNVLGISIDKYVRENEFGFQENIFNLKGSRYFDGYWQSPKYFEEFEEEIRGLFSFPKPLSESAKSYLEKINQALSVSLHIRRGDYVSDKSTNDTHGTCTKEYYVNGVGKVLAAYPEAHFFVFSDDLDWARLNTEFLPNRTIIESSSMESDWEEMFLMSRCRHNIIANSTFSWWGAWLNRNPDKMVISPKQWFAKEEISTVDLIPQTWIRI